MDTCGRGKTSSYRGDSVPPIYEKSSEETFFDTPLAPARQGRLGTQGELPEGQEKVPWGTCPEAEVKKSGRAGLFWGILCGLLRQACPACSGASRRNAAGNCALRALSLRALCARTLGWTGDYMSGTYRTDTYYLDCTRKTGICYLDCTRRAGTMLSGLHS